jgi:hypothetical protein
MGNVVPTRKFSSDTAQRLKRELAAKLAGVEIEIRKVDKIPLNAAGKQVNVVSEV